MARLWSCGAELNSVTDGVEVTTNTLGGSDLTVDSTIKRTGSYSFKLVGNTSSPFQRQNILTSTANTLVYARAYFYFTAFPSATTQLFRFSDTANAMKSNISVTSTGVLRLIKANGVQLGSDSTALNLSQWYRLELKHDASTSPGTLDAQIDGVSFASGQNSSQGGWARLLWGFINVATTSGVVYVDDIAVNDSTGSFQTNLPGSGGILHLKPNTTGDANSFAVQVGGTAGGANNFTRVQEVPPDDATTYNASAILNQEDLFNCNDSGIGSGDTVNVVSIGARFADLVGTDATSAFKLEVEKTSGGTKSQSSNIVPNSTSFITNTAAEPRNYPITLYQDPDGSNWTQTTLDSMQIGYILSAVNVQSIAVTTVWALVDYTPGVSTVIKQRNLMLMGLG